MENESKVFNSAANLIKKTTCAVIKSKLCSWIAPVNDAVLQVVVLF